MGSIGPSEITIIVIIALALFGSTRLPAMAKGVGGAIREFKKEISGPTDEPADSSDGESTPAQSESADQHPSRSSSAGPETPG